MRTLSPARVMACSTCGRDGHYAPWCPKSKKRKAPLPPSSPPVVVAAAATRYCSTCGKPGHVKTTCPKRFKKTSSTCTCSVCKRAGHNKTSCPQLKLKTTKVPTTPKSKSKPPPPVVAKPVVKQSPKPPVKRRRHHRNDVSESRLYALSMTQLRVVCNYSERTARGSKVATIETLVASRLRYSDLRLNELRAMCVAEKLATSGVKDAVIARLTRSKPAAVAVYKTQQKATGALVKKVSGPMSRATYRQRLRAAGVIIYSDQDVLHIVASENGGADCAENYLFVGSRSPNRAMGSRYDYFYAWLAGTAHAREAVRVSRLYGNAKGKRYTGPSAEQLITRGNTLSREIRLWDKAKKAK